MGACCNAEALSSDVKNLTIIISQNTNSNQSISLGKHPISQTDLEEKSTKKQINNKITKYMKDVEKKENRIIKLLLLGSGSSGKSTLFRQIECIHGYKQEGKRTPNYKKAAVLLDGNRTNYKRSIRLNCMDGLIKLLKQSEILSKPPHNKSKCAINVADEEIANAITILADLSNVFEFDEKFSNGVDAAIAAETMHLLWQLDGVKETFKNRQYFSLPENLDYFLDKIFVVMDESDRNRYVPSLEDILKTRVQTLGIIERTYFIGNMQFNMFDVGGQRNERKKWMQLFDKVNAVIFVAALNHYCSVLFEDESVNGMQESIKLFEETVNSKWFSSNNTQWILFLNKNDLFVKRLKDDRIPLRVCFGDEFDGAEYGGDDEQEFGKCYRHCINFIKAQYLSRIKNVESIKHVSIHVTVATEKSHIQKVFSAVTTGIVRNNFQAAGYTK